MRDPMILDAMTELKTKHRYKYADGKRWIEVRVKNPLQLFDARDPAPFRERDIDDDFLEYIMASAREFSTSIPLKIVIYIEENETKELSKDSIREAIRSFLAYRIDLQRGELRRFMRRAQLFVIIGLAVLISCLAVAQTLVVPSHPGAIGILREGIVIFGWVSIWKPIELILFDWYPIYEMLRFFRRLLETEIDVRFSQTQQAQ
jgi:hypothetical protein